MAKHDTNTSNTKTETKTILPDLTQSAGNTAVAVAPQVATTPTYDPAYLDSLPTKNAMVRYLHGRGLSMGQIAKVSVNHPKMKYKDGRPMLFQHVRNILVTPVKNPK